MINRSTVYNHNLFTIAAWSVLAFLVASCDNGIRESPNVDHLEVSVKIERLDQQLFKLKDKEEIAGFLEDHPIFSEEFLHVDQYPHDSMAVNYLNGFVSNPASQVIQQEINTVFGNVDQLRLELEQAFKYLLHYYPATKIPKLYTAVTGFAGNDLFVSDSVIIIGLDYYLGEGATYRPLEFPKYILKRYRPEYIVPSIILLMSSTMNNTEMEDKTMLAEMVYYGKAYYFTQQILPGTPDSLLIGYSTQEILDATDNQDVIWAHFVENQLLYESSHFIKKKYMDERPKTLEIGNKCPGRIGEWLGWQIVDQFMEQQPVSLTELMSNSDAPQIFMQSKYKPQAL
ncbi:MAG: hypothetical protein DHS20C17_25550 [Cyclobacteriaceae bacterium]|nr:MAG: hypothetical protein DHS20C17_25550 [Cyclobacteriaceae bacterium]